MVLSNVVLPAVLLIISVVYLYVKYSFSYWKRRNIPTLNPSFPFGNYKDTFLLKKSIGDTLKDMYFSTTEPFVGIYTFLRPSLLVRDYKLVNDVLIKDFQHFHDHGTFYDEINDPLSANLFSLEGAKWKNLRQKLSPSFTSGKIRAMFSTIVSCGDSLQKKIDVIAKESQPFEVRELSAQYATNVIASVAFGIDINCIEDPETPFRKYGRKIFDANWKNGLRFMCMFLFPPFLKFFKIRSIDKDVEDFMVSVVSQTLKYREESNTVRKDFFQLLVQLRNTGAVQLDNQWETVITGDERTKKLSLNELAAQAYVFWIAGFETSSTTMAFCMYEIAKNPEVQENIHKEIDQVLQNHGGQITYESVNEMKYLECCIDGKAMSLGICTPDSTQPINL